MIPPVRPHRAPRASRSALLLLAALAALGPARAQPEPAAPPSPATAEPAPVVETTGLTSIPPAEEVGLTPLPPPPPPSPVEDIMAAPPEPTPYGAPLTLESAIAQALDANFDIQMQRLTTQSTAENEAIARADYDPTLGASASTGQSQNTRPTVDASGNIIPLPGTRTDTDDFGLSVTQRTPLGTTITGATGLTRRDSNQVSLTSLDPAYDSDVGITIRQPLLKGAGTTINNAAIERARLGTERARADFAAQVFTVVRDIEIGYSNLALSRELVGIRTFSLEVRKKLLEENRARRDTGVATDLEVLQAEVGVATAARDLLLARQNARDSQDQLLRLLGHQSFEHPVGPVTLPAATAPNIDLAASLERARANTPEFFSALASIRQQEIDILTAKNNKLPQLDLGGRAAYTSTNGTLRTSNANLWDGDGYNWQVDLSLSLPWGFREEKARLRQAKAGRDREELRLAQIEQTILVEVRDAVRALETSVENLRLSTLTAELSAREFEVEKARYDSGLSTFRAVQEAQDDYDLARLAELQAKVDLRTALANLDRLEGTAPTRYNLTLAP